MNAIRTRIRAHAAIALVSLALLIAEIALMRVFSVLYWYYFAFFAISLALLGGAAAAATLTAWERARPGVAARVAAPAAAACGLLAAAAPLLLLGVVQPALAGSTGTGALVLAGAIFFLPFYSGGLVIASLLTRHAAQPGSLYWADLGGAAAGCLVAVPLLWLLPAPALLAWCGVAPALAAWLLAERGAPGRRLVQVAAGIAAVGALVLAALGAEGGGPLAVRWSKGRLLDAGKITERWTPLARLTVYDSVFWRKDPARAFAWGGGAGPAGAPLEQYWIEQDETAGTPITRWDGDPQKLGFLGADVTNAAYLVRPYDRVLAIGPGGGRDILAARHFGARAITAVELNPAMVELVEERFGDFSGRPYSLPGVETVVAEARSWIARADGRQWDLVQLSLVDSWAASMAGAFALAENTLYTREAFETFFSRLSPDGVLTVSRWYPAEALRLAHLAAAALERLGVREPRRHIAIVRGGTVATLIACRRPLSETEVQRLVQGAAGRGFAVLASPGEGPRDPLFQGLLDAPDRTGFLQRFPADFSVPTDDRPFFFLFSSLFSGQRSDVDPSRAQYPQDPSGTLLALLVLLAAVAAALVALPLFLARPGTGGPSPLLDWPYFAALGLGFMLVELALVQRFVLYLGHPTFATSVVFFGLLIAAASGSLASARLARDRGPRRGALLALGAGLALIALHATAVPALLDATLGWPAPARVALALATLLPLGAALGTALPLGLARLSAVGAPGSAPYALGVNAVFSVLATVLATVVTISWGNRATMMAGFAAYAVAAWNRRPESR